MINGTAKSVMPRLAIHSGVSRSSWTTSHSASKAPIIKNTPAASTTAPATTFDRSRSTASRCPLGSTVSSTVSRMVGTNSTIVAADTTMNGDASPRSSSDTSTADTAGPIAKPNTSALRSRPRFSPTFSVSVRITIRRIAGRAAPIPMPDTMRPAINTSRVSP